MEINAYLNFNGTCEEAFRFYETTLGGTIVTMQKHGETPMADQMPEEWHDRIMHAHLKVGDAILYGSDGPPDFDAKPAGFSVSLQIPQVEDAERIFDALSREGSVTMPLTETFWAKRFGMLVDRFRIPWVVNCA